MKKYIFNSLLMLFSLVMYSQNDVLLVVDTSLSMMDRDTEKELQLLDNYFSKNKEVSVGLLTFNNGIDTTQNFNITNGNWSELKNAFNTLTYDGGTSFKNLSAQLEAPTVFLFTDGAQNIFLNTIATNSTLYVINSSSNYDATNLKNIAFANKGRLINYASTPGNERYYRGRVYNKGQAFEGVKISVKDKEANTVSGEDGSFKIKAEINDVLVFEVLGATTVERKIEGNENFDVFLDIDGIELGEVQLSFKKNKIPQAIVEEEKLVTGFGSIKKEAVGYSYTTIDGDDIDPSYTNVSQAILGKTTGLEKGLFDDLSQSVIRGFTTFNGNNYALVVVDDVQLKQSNSASGGGVELSNFIDPANIADIKILKGLAAANRYGSLGKNGVILITTKQYANSKKALGDSNLEKDNIYRGNANLNKEINTPIYIQSLKEEKTVAAAYQKYLLERATYWDNPTYFIDVFDFFNNKDQQLALKILTNVIEGDQDAVEGLRAMYFKATKQKNYELALDAAYEEFDAFPQKIQSYMDVAIANKNAGKYQLALDMLIGISSGNINPNLDFKGLEKMADNEIISLVKANIEGLDTSKVLPLHREAKPIDMRVVVEWNNPDAEFELQFVNPEKKFFKWEHTTAVNADRISKELENGYLAEDFEIDGGSKGNWLINAKNLGNRTSGNVAATFINCTVYYNFGSENQTSTNYLIRLSEPNEEKTLARLSIQ